MSYFYNRGPAIRGWDAVQGGLAGSWLSCCFLICVKRISGQARGVFQVWRFMQVESAR